MGLTESKPKCDKAIFSIIKFQPGQIWEIEATGVYAGGHEMYDQHLSTDSFPPTPTKAEMQSKFWIRILPEYPEWKLGRQFIHSLTNNMFLSFLYVEQVTQAVWLWEE